MTGGRLHHDIRQSSPPPSFVTLPPPSLPLLFSPFLSPFELTMRAGPFSRFAALSCAFRHAAFRSVSPVTDCRSGGRDNNNCQRSNISQASREEEKEHEGDGGSGVIGGRTRARTRARWGERGVDRPIYRTGNKHRAAGVDPSGYRRVYTASVISSSRAKWRRDRANLEYPLLSGYRWKHKERTTSRDFFIFAEKVDIRMARWQSSRNELTSIIRHR